MLLCCEAHAQEPDFTFDLFKEIARRNADGNFVLSPISVETPLRLIASGAREKTASELNSALGSPKKTNEIRDSNSPIHINCSLWTQSENTLLAEFLDTAKNNHNAEIFQADFAQNSGEAVKNINEWVNEKTQGKIATLFDRLDSSVRVVVIGAIHLTSHWKFPFEQENTLPGTFTLTSGDACETDFMQQTARFRLLENEKVFMLELPYQDEQFSLLLLLPKEKKGLGQLEKELNTKNLSEWCDGFSIANVDVRLPRFTTTFESKLNESLQSLGIKTAFSREADFSGVNGHRDLFLSKVVQKTFLKIDETGTQASSSSGAVLSLKSMSLDVKSFFANRPFLYILRQTDDPNTLGTVWFIGRFARPMGEPPTISNSNLDGEGGTFH